MCPTTELDANQVLKGAYDEANQRLRVDAEITATFGQLEVTLLSNEDNISIGNTSNTRFAEITTDSELQTSDAGAKLSLDSINNKLTTVNLGLDIIDAELQLKANESTLLTRATETTLLTRATESTLGTRASESTLSTLNSKFVSGTDIGDVTINNASGASAVNIQDGGNSITVDGSISVSNFPAVQPVSDNGGSLTVDGSVAVSNFPVSQAVTGPLTDIELRASPVSTSVSNFPAVQPVSDNGSSLTVDGTVGISGSVAVTGSLTDAELRATPIPVSGTITAIGSGNFTVVQPTGSNLHTVIDSGTISLPSGASTSALQTTGNSSLSSIDGKLATLGQKNMAGSTPVVIASDQSVLPISGTISGTGNFTVIQPIGSNLHTVLDSGTLSTITNVVHVDDNGGSLTVDGTISALQSGIWNINNISGIISLPTGASTAANQTIANANLASIDADIDVALSTRASESTLSTLNNKFSNNYGTSTNAIRTASQIGNTLGQADFNAGITGVQTLRTTANITRNGTELSYNNGVVDSNTLRVTQASNIPVTVIQPTHDNLNLNANLQVSDIDVSNTNPVPIVPVRSTLTDFSGTATAASVSILAANSNRRYVFLQNTSNQTIWFNFTIAATTASPSIKLGPGETFVMEGTFVSTEQIFIIRGGAINAAFTGKVG